MNERNEIIVTKEGLDKLKGQLKELLEVQRPQIAQRIKDARDMGDISENSEYDAAKEKQAFIEGKIAELEEVIKNAKVVESNGSKHAVDIGAKVTVHIEGSKEEFHIVGAHEADPLERKISHESPLGSALLGKKVGEKIEVDAPVGKLTYKVLKIEY